MDEGYIDIAKMIWNEMNPIEGYNSNRQDMYINNMRKYKEYIAHVFKNNINDIIEMDPYTRSSTSNNLKDLKKVNIPSNTGEVVGYPNTSVYDAYKLTKEYVKPINNNFDKIKNRIPTKSLGKLVNKILNEPVVKNTGKVAGKVAIPLAIIDGIGLNQPVY